MNYKLVQTEYLTLLKKDGFNEAHKYLEDYFNESDIKSDIRRTDWIHLCEMGAYDYLLIIGDSLGELALHFSSIFKYVDVIVSDEIDSKIIELLSTTQTNIKLINYPITDISNQYNIVYIDPSYKIDQPLASFYDDISTVIKKDGRLAVMDIRKLLSWPSNSKALEEVRYSVEAKYGWLPAYDQSPVFLFDTSNKFVLIHFLQNMINIFRSVSPEYIRKYFFKIMALKVIKKFIIFKHVRAVFLKILPCTLLICKYDQNN